MDTVIPGEILNRLTTFGELLRYLRRRAGLTQTELSIAVGYSDAQISRLEQNLRLPNLATVQARFLPVLRLKGEPGARERLLALAEQAQQQRTDSHMSADGQPAQTPSIAVLPFLNLSTATENDYFCEGLAEELISALTRIRGVFVVARSSAFSFRAKDADVREIGRRLNVDTILEGSVQKVGDRLRVTAQLVDAANGFQFWSEHFDRQMTDVFDIQDEITLAIVKHLKVELLAKDRVAVLAKKQANLESYNLYLKGRFYWAQRPQGVTKAIEFFQRAIDRDPTSARAHAGLADCYATLGSWENGTLPPIDAMAMANAAATKALELDNRLAEAHTTLAYRTIHHDWDWTTAETQFQRAFGLNPNYAVCHHWYSHYLTAVGRPEESLQASKRCLELDPLDLVLNIHMAWHFHFARQYEEAVEQCWKTSELHPNSFWPSWFFGLAYEQQGQIDRAEEELHIAVKMSGDVTFASAALGHLFGIAGKTAEARSIFEELTGRATRSYVPAYDLALVCAGLGWKDQALGYLSRARQERSGWMTYINVDPRLDPLREDPRFVELLRCMRLMKPLPLT
ncbi:MAG TPA: helix-turn-helix domain-containing protein [Steroidobacteraceae bacterium]|jgi:TolB-like protein/Tfp pilus assembly protein PilF/DNA-binding XRE family transcriptional regulator